MPIVSYPSLDEGDVVEISFLKPTGGDVTLRLLVDSGFTGQSCFVLPASADEWAQAPAPSSLSAGALSGEQRRVVVTCRIPALSFHRSVIAILGDLSVLALPPGVDGLAGLRFLRHFRCWGATQMAEGGWRFFLSDDIWSSANV